MLKYFFKCEVDDKREIFSVKPHFKLFESGHTPPTKYNGKIKDLKALKIA
jgi:hypothetical protein